MDTRTLAPTLYLLAAACGGATAPTDAAPHAGEAPAETEAAGETVARSKAKAKTKAGPPRNAPPDVVLVILDTVRANHTSLCGYDRPTTPFLEKLVADFGGSHSCQAYSPGAWTLPSHATYFTGELLPEHHYDSVKVPDWSERTTLAEHMAAAGYETVIVTANPVLVQGTGLLKGFEHIVAADKIDAWRGPKTAAKVKEALQGADLDKPLFLVVNIMDAHDPYMPVPDGVGWVPKRRGIDFKVQKRDDAEPYHRYLKGLMSDEERKNYLAAITDTYDYGIFKADQSLKAVMGLLGKAGRTQKGLQLVVTSDHGEFLGEHGLLRHGGWVWEPVVHVPLVVVDTRPDQSAPELPKGPMSAAHVFDLVKDGRLPHKLRDVVAYSSASHLEENPGSDSVAVWSPKRQKLRWMDDTVARFDLRADPDELEALDAPEHPLKARLANHVRGYKAHVEWRAAQEAVIDDIEALKALGYVEKAGE